MNTKKAKRKAFRKLKKQKFKEIIKASETELNIDLDNSKFIDVFNQVWPILKPALEYAEMIRITGKKADEVIRIVIEQGDRMSKYHSSGTEQSVFITYLDPVWGYIKIILKIAKTFTGNKADEVIDRIIEIGEWIVNDEPGGQNKL